MNVLANIGAPMLTLLEAKAQQAAEGGSNHVDEALTWCMISHPSEAAPVLVRLLKSENDRTREMAARILLQTPDPLAAKALLAAMDDTQERVVTLSAEALCLLRDRCADAARSGDYKGRQADWQAIAALVPSVSERMVKALDDPRDKVAAAATAFLQYQDSPSANARFLAMMRDPKRSFSLRRRAATALLLGSEPENWRAVADALLGAGDDGSRTVFFGAMLAIAGKEGPSRIGAILKSTGEPVRSGFVAMVANLPTDAALRLIADVSAVPKEARSSARAVLEAVRKAYPGGGAKSFPDDYDAAKVREGDRQGPRAPFPVRASGRDVRRPAASMIGKGVRHGSN